MKFNLSAQFSNLTEVKEKTRFDCFNEQLPRVTTPQPDAVLG